MKQEEVDELAQLKVVQLKALCKERGLKVSGKKSELQERLREHFLSSFEKGNNHEDLEEMTDDDLRDALIARGINSTGSRKQMLDRLKADIDFTTGVMAESQPTNKDGYAAISLALEEAAKKDGGAISEILSELKQKSEVVPKFVDVKVRSLGLSPEKYTAGGAPSVTADVLRKLAGDPFADPPKYGSVR